MTLLLLAALVLSGCARLPLAGGDASGSTQPGALAPIAGTGAAPALPLPADPVAAFAATATPGAQGQVVLPTSGRSARVRLLRAYHAASGRECREVLVGTGLEERSSLVCLHETGWATSRPLLQGSVAGGGGQVP